MLTAVTLAMLGLASLSRAAHAQGRLDARYTASLAGIPVGRGAWVVDIGTDKYVAAASGITSGLLRIFSSGEGTGASRGYILHGRFAPASYAASITAGRKTDEVRMALSGGDVKELAVTPTDKPEDDDRVKVTEAHRHGVVDPMTASLFRSKDSGDPLSPSICHRTEPIFDGRLRYDVEYSFKRMEHVAAEKGYAGPVVVCAMYFHPIAGHVPDRAAIKYLTKLRTMEVWLAPITGTKVLVPFRISVPTPIGLGVVEATRFETLSHRASALPAAAPQP